MTPRYQRPWQEFMIVADALNVVSAQTQSTWFRAPRPCVPDCCIKPLPALRRLSVRKSRKVADLPGSPASRGRSSGNGEAPAPSPSLLRHEFVLSLLNFRLALSRRGLQRCRDPRSPCARPCTRLPPKPGTPFLLRHHHRGGRLPRAHATSTVRLFARQGFGSSSSCGAPAIADAPMGQGPSCAWPMLLSRPLLNCHLAP